MLFLEPNPFSIATHFITSDCITLDSIVGNLRIIKCKVYLLDQLYQRFHIFTFLYMLPDYCYIQYLMITIIIIIHTISCILLYKLLIIYNNVQSFTRYSFWLII